MFRARASSCGCAGVVVFGSTACAAGCGRAHPSLRTHLPPCSALGQFLRQASRRSSLVSGSPVCRMTLRPPAPLYLLCHQPADSARTCVLPPPPVSQLASPSTQSYGPSMPTSRAISAAYRRYKHPRDVLAGAAATLSCDINSTPRQMLPCPSLRAASTVAPVLALADDSPGASGLRVFVRRTPPAFLQVEWSADGPRAGPIGSTHQTKRCAWMPARRGGVCSGCPCSGAPERTGRSA